MRRPRPVDLVTIFSSSDPVETSIVKSLLEAEGIPFVAGGEAAQDLVGLGRFPCGYNPMVGPSEIRVDREMADAVTRLIKGRAKKAGVRRPRK